VRSLVISAHSLRDAYRNEFRRGRTMQDWAIVLSQIALMAPDRPSGPSRAAMDTTARLEP
jgi:hypothetical protein